MLKFLKLQAVHFWRMISVFFEGSSEERVSMGIEIFGLSIV